MCLTPFIQINPIVFTFLKECKCTLYLNNLKVKSRLYSYASITSAHILRLSGFCHLSFNENHLCVDSPEKVESFIKSNYISFSGGSFPVFVNCPCGRCSHCVFDMRNELVNRTLLEASYSKGMYFLTLTYDDRHLPSDGLHKEHFSKFFVTFRRRCKEQFGSDIDFRCIFCGEYGTNPLYTKRPHYHAILFCNRYLSFAEVLSVKYMLMDKHFFYLQKQKINKFKRKYSPLWPYGKRFDFQLCNSKTAASRYVTKYLFKQYADNHPVSQNPVFIQTPRHIGLGCTNLPDTFERLRNSIDGCITVPIGTSSATFKVPKVILSKFAPSLSQFCPGYKVFIALYKYLKSQHLDKLLSSRLSEPSPLRYDYVLKYFYTFNSRHHVDPLREIDLYIAFFPDISELIEIVYSQLMKIPPFDLFLQLTSERLKYMSLFPDNPNSLTLKSNKIFNQCVKYERIIKQDKECF